jgi:hypothetical protein
MEALIMKTVVLIVGASLTASTLALSGCAVDADAPVTPKEAMEVGTATENAIALQQGAVDLTTLGKDWVLTPRGYYHHTCVQDIGDDARVDEEGTIHRPDGTTFRLPTCAYPNYPAPAVEEPTVNGWVTDAFRHNANGYKRFNAGWEVPAKPSSNGGLVYIFPGFEREDGSRIIQPVLQYGYNYDFGGDYWTIASWSCDNGNNCPHSTPRTVHVGDQIVGHIAGSNCSSNVCDWTVTTKDTTTGVASTLTWNANVPYTWGFVALEAYGIDNCSQYPNQNSLTMSTTVYRTDGTLATADWDVQNQPVSPSCGRNTTYNGHLSATLHWIP